MSRSVGLASDLLYIGWDHPQYTGSYLLCSAKFCESPQAWDWMVKSSYSSQGSSHELIHSYVGQFFQQMCHLRCWGTGHCLYGTTELWMGNGGVGIIEPLTHADRGTMGNIFKKKILRKNFIFWFKFHWFFFLFLIDDSTLVKVMAWHQTGYKPLPDPVVINSCDTI